MSDAVSGGSSVADQDSGLSHSPPSSGGRRRAAAFSYSRVRDDGAEQRRQRLSSRCSSDTDGAAATTANGRDGTSSVSDCSTGSTAATASSSASSTGASGAAGTKYDFVEDVPSCGLCGELMEDPLQTQCCSTDYCQTCLSPNLNTTPTQGRTKFKFIRSSQKLSGVECPDCKMPNVKLKVNEELRAKVAALHVRCVYVAAGCVWEGQRAWLTEHKGGCTYASVVCSNCGMQLLRKQERNHAVAECGMRMVQCQFCERQDTHESINTTHYQHCPKYPVPCTLNCGETVPRSELQYHLDNECVTKGLRCPFRSLGCGQSLLPEEEMERHVASCGVLHLGDMMKRFTAEMSEMKEQVQSLRSENEALRQEVERSSAAMETTSSALATLQSRSEAITTTLVSELEYYCHSREPHELIAVECLKTMLCSESIVLQAGGFPATIRMTSYTRHKESGQVWQSPPFFVLSGYKMRLGVHLNGVGAGKGSHVSMILHHLAGERDDQLEWPYLLKDRVKVSLLRQTDTFSPSQTTTTTLHRSSSPRRVMGGRVHLLSTSSPSPSSPSSPSSPPRTTHTLPPNASPIRERRRLADRPRPPPLNHANETTLVVIETQTLTVSPYLHRISSGENALGGVAVAKIELFCTQSSVAEAVYCDSLAFQLTMCSANLTDGSIAC